MDMTDLLREVRELRQRIDDFEVPQRATTGSLPTVVIEKDPAQTAAKLKPTKFPIYNGDRATYPAWRKAVLSALKMDWNTFNYTDSRVFLMIYKALEGKAQRQAGTYFEAGGVGGKEKPENFIAFLDRGNWDQTRVVRARAELNEMRMGAKQRWSSFYSQWANKLTEALGDTWPEETKVSLLKSTLNLTLKTALASNHLVPDNDIYEFTRIVSKIAHQHEEIPKGFTGYKSVDTKRSNSPTSFQDGSSAQSNNDNRTTRWNRSEKEMGLVGNVDSSGDTIMGGVNSSNVLRGPNGKALRAKWKSHDQIAKLRSEGRCFRCENKGCNTKICRLLPARKPELKGPTINVNDFLDLDPNLYEEEDEPELAEN